MSNALIIHAADRAHVHDDKDIPLGHCDDREHGAFYM